MTASIRDLQRQIDERRGIRDQQPASEIARTPFGLASHRGNAVATIAAGGEPATTLRVDVGRVLVRRLALALARQRFVSGGAIAARLGNTPETAAVLSALLASGAAIAPACGSFKDESLLRSLVALSPVALVGSEDRELGWSLHDLVAVAAGLPSVRSVIGTGAKVPDGIVPLAALAREDASATPEVAVAESTRALVLIDDGNVSGALTHAELARLGLRLAAEAGITDASRLLCPVLLASTQGVVGALAPALLTGATLLVDRPFDAGRFLNALRLAAATHTLLPGPIATALRDDPRFSAWIDAGGTVVAFWTSTAAMRQAERRSGDPVIDLVRTRTTTFAAKRRSVVSLLSEPPVRTRMAG